MGKHLGRINKAGNRADILGLGFPPLRFLHYYFLQPLDFLRRQAGLLCNLFHGHATSFHAEGQSLMLPSSVCTLDDTDIIPPNILSALEVFQIFVWIKRKLLGWQEIVLVFTVGDEEWAWFTVSYYWLKIINFFRGEVSNISDFCNGVAFGFHLAGIFMFGILAALIFSSALCRCYCITHVSILF